MPTGYSTLGSATIVSSIFCESTILLQLTKFASCVNSSNKTVAKIHKWKCPSNEYEWLADYYCS